MLTTYTLITKPINFLSMNTIKTLRFGVLALALGSFIACGGDSDKAEGPAGVAEAFLNAIENGKFNKAKKYASEDSQEALEGMANMAEMGENLGDGEEHTPGKIVIGEVTESEDGNSATVAYTKDGSDMSLEMIKEGGDWKAVYSKMPDMDDMGDMGDMLDESGDMLDDAGDMMEGALDSLSDAMGELDELMEELGN